VENISFLFAFFQHTQIIKKLPYVDYFLNTPSHHRVHHSSNEEYINKNYGNTLIIFDRLFGTFKEEKEGVLIKYGLTNNIKTFNLFKVIFHEWLTIFKRNVIK
jgi:sterol desaturase/sphingolipid hydroxylase (fatty acid hydroxylase superfamily)